MSASAPQPKPVSSLRAGAWGRLYASMADSPKCAAVSNPAMGLWARCLAWAVENGGDEGFVPYPIVLRFCPGGTRELRRLVAELTTIAPGQRNPLWHAVDGGWTFHDWTEHQTPSSVRKQRRAAQVERQRTYENKKRASSDASPDVTPTRQDACTDTSHDASLEGEGESSDLRSSGESEASAEALAARACVREGSGQADWEPVLADIYAQTHSDAAIDPSAVPSWLRRISALEDAGRGRGIIVTGLRETMLRGKGPGVLTHIVDELIADPAAAYTEFASSQLIEGWRSVVTQLLTKVEGMTPSTGPVRQWLNKALEMHHRGWAQEEIRDTLHRAMVEGAPASSAEDYAVARRVA